MNRQILIVFGVIGILNFAATVGADDIFKVFNDVVQVDTNVPGVSYNNDFVFGSDKLDYDTTVEASRFFFDKSRATFRAGFCNNTNWDEGCRASYSFGEGYNTYLTGEYSHAEGYETRAWADASHAEGLYSKSYLYGQHSHASGYFNNPSGGEAQYSQLIARNVTSGGTFQKVRLYLDGIGTRAVLPASTVWVFQIFVAGRQFTGEGTGTSAAYKFEGIIKRDNQDNTTLVGNFTKTILVEEKSDWDATIAADDSSHTLEVEVTGEAYKTIRWVATINLTEVGG